MYSFIYFAVLFFIFNCANLTFCTHLEGPFTFILVSLVDDIGDEDNQKQSKLNHSVCVFVCGFACVGGVEDNVLWIAMAGTHQIWALFLADGKLPKGR